MVVEVSAPKVLNKRAATKEELSNSVYVGRPPRGGNEHYGNPFSHKEGTKATKVLATREAAISAFRDWLSGDSWQGIEQERRRWVLENLRDLKGKNLVCWCAPASCHADILLRLANKEAGDGTLSLAATLEAAAMEAK